MEVKNSLITLADMNTKFADIYKKVCKNLGENNDALYGVLTIAASKGVLRPTFTMMDKKQDRPSRMYTACREGTTGAVAFIAYLITHKGVEKLVQPLCKKANILGKEKEVKATLSLVTVSLTALFVIPFICNKITKPILDTITHKKNNTVQPLKQDIKADMVKPNVSMKARTVNHYNSPYRNYNYGLRIGG